MIHATLVFDDGPGSGMGHRRRMWALAGALQELNCRARMMPTHGAPIHADVVVVDSYRYRADDRAYFRAPAVAAIDDLARDLTCDLVVDPNPGADSGAHQAAGRSLAGAAYALVDPELCSLVTQPLGGEVRTVLIASGASDPGGAGARIAAQLARLLPAVAIQLAVGPWAQSDVPEGVVALRTTSGLGPALAGADLVVTAAGVTLVEALALGRPVVTVVLAENQRQAARGVADAGAAVTADISDAPEVAARLAHDAVRRYALAAAARSLVDGHGARRVARAVLESAG